MTSISIKRFTCSFSREGQDDVIPFADSEELVANSGLPPETFIEIGTDHRLAEAEPLKAMLEACEKSANNIMKER